MKILLTFIIAIALAAGAWYWYVTYYVSTPTPTPAADTTADTSTGGEAGALPIPTSATVILTAEGFSPTTIVIKQGGTVLQRILKSPC